MNLLTKKIKTQDINFKFNIEKNIMMKFKLCYTLLFCLLYFSSSSFAERNKPLNKNEFEVLNNTIYEAEDGELFNGATIQDCETCSGGQQVGDLGGNNQSYFTYDIQVDEAGVYDLTLVFSSGDPRSIFISANNGTPIEYLALSGGWETVAEDVIQLNLQAGNNTIKFFNDIGFGPNIDFFSVEYVSASGTFFEAEDGQLFNGATIQDCANCSGGLQVGDLGGDSQSYFTYAVEVVQSGSYPMQISFSSGEPRAIFISANNSNPIEVVVESGGWDVVAETEVAITLESGINELKFYNDIGFGPNIDGFFLDATAADTENPVTDVYEAEDGQLFDGATIQNCGTCSGGRKVGDLGGDNQSYFTYDVNAEDAGTYNLNFTFISGDPRSIFISINNGPATEVQCESANWETTADTELEVTLNSGNNTIRFFNNIGFAPDIDKFSLELIDVNIPICPDCDNLVFGQNNEIVYDTSSGTFDIINNGSTIVDDAFSEVIVNNLNYSSQNYSNITINQTSNSDNLGTGVKMEVNLSGNGLPNMKQVFYAYAGKNYLLVDVQIEGTNLESNYMAPIVCNNVSLGGGGETRVLKVPYDNDTFIRYESNQVANNSSNISSEVTALYNNNSRNGLVTGSVNQTVWKTGVETQGDGSNLNNLRVWGGFTSENLTRDVLEHGKISGNSLDAPRVFIGFFEDWRVGMEEYGEATKINNQKYIQDWSQPTPFGWNSWGSIQEDLTLDKAKQL